MALERRGKDSLRHFLLPGFCGGLTTFSAVAFESVEGSGGEQYLAISFLLSLVVTATCIPIARKVIVGNA